MAPEIYELNRFDFKVDVWALGLIFGYTLSGGKHPFGDDSYYERQNRIKKKESMVFTKADLIESFSNDPFAFELIGSMLAIEPEKRPTTREVVNSCFFFPPVRICAFSFFFGNNIHLICSKFEIADKASTVI